MFSYGSLLHSLNSFVISFWEEVSYIALLVTKSVIKWIMLWLLIFGNCEKEWSNRFFKRVVCNFRCFWSRILCVALLLSLDMKDIFYLKRVVLEAKPSDLESLKQIWIANYLRFSIIKGLFVIWKWAYVKTFFVQLWSLFGVEHVIRLLLWPWPSTMKHERILNCQFK